MTQYISAETFCRCTRFVETHARPLDQAIFRHTFTEGSSDDVRLELATFRNEDGGFGNGLESDFLLPDSSAIATWVGLGLLVELETPVDHPLVAGAVDYLLHTMHTDDGRWATVPPAVNDHPHASWWQYDESKGGTMLDGTPWNPTAALTGYLTYYARLCPAGLLIDLQTRALHYLEAQADDGVDMFELSCFITLARQVPADLRPRFHQALKTGVGLTVETDPAKWSEYGAEPLGFVDGPNSFLYPDLHDAVEANLDFWIETLPEDGGWQPSWTWGIFDDVFAATKPGIAGHVTVERLRRLHAFGRIEG